MSVARARAKSRRTSAKAASRRGRGPDAAPKALLYKVVELSSVDERTLEDTVNGWVRQGWSFDGVQFAMRESSKRPAMAFVFFTREGELADESASRPPAELHPVPTAPPPSRSAYDRLRELAGDDAL